MNEKINTIVQDEQSWNYQGTWLSEEQILKQIESEFRQCENSTLTKRYRFRDRLATYMNLNKIPDKVNVNLVFSNMQALMATEMSDELEIEFLHREHSDYATAQNWNMIADFDKEEMGLNEMNYQKLRDKYFYWVGIRYFDAWNEFNNTPSVKVVDPMTWIPDPRWHSNIENFRFFWFQTSQNRLRMDQNWFENVDKFMTPPDFQFYMYNPFNNIRANTEQSTNQDTIYRYVLFWYTIINWEKYQIATNFDFSVIWRVVKIEDVLQVEKKWADTLRPVSLTYFRPRRHDPFWDSLLDITEDKQQALSRLINLAISKATRSSLGNYRIYNKDKFPNRNDLSNLTVEPKLIWVNLNPWETLDWVIRELEFPQVPNDNFNVQEVIEKQSRYATWVDPLTMWVQWSGTMTATEAQQIQANANLILGLTSLLDTRWEKDFWMKWMKMYKQNFKWKKIIRITNPIWANVIELKKWHIKTKQDPDIIIKARSQVNKVKEQQFLAMQYFLPMITSNPNRWDSPFNSIFAMRYALETKNIPEDVIKMIIPEKAEEIEANKQLLLLNENVDLEAIQDLNEDHDAYISIYKQAIDTSAKRKAIEARRQAKIEKKKMMATQVEQQSQQQWLLASSNSQMMSNAMQKDKKPLSTADAV